MIGQSISKNSMILTAFAIATAGILAFTYQSTASRIAAAERKAAEAALLEIVPRQAHDNDMLSDVVPLSPELRASLGLKGDDQAHIAYLKGKPVAIILPAVAPDGYSGDIKLIIGINADGSVAGVRTLSHKETPGLGDKVDIRKSDWITRFAGKSLNNPKIERWSVRKDGGDFDQFTGATITPRAVVKRVKSTLMLFAENREQLLGIEKGTTGK
ncbi:electron transport complex protein RnfG [Alteromonadaceae bacterium 2753L.S.0a.02]|nr:electron transport complex protein RnfG [Alteromonadaceae bacterium 2753L.S.0a.02]